MTELLSCTTISYLHFLSFMGSFLHVDIFSFVIDGPIFQIGGIESYYFKSGGWG